MSTFKDFSYSSDEKAEIKKWLTLSEQLKNSEESEKSTLIKNLNDHLASRTTILDTKPSEADIALYQSLAQTVSSWTVQERTGENGYPHIVRHLDFVQNSPLFNLRICDEEKIKIDPDDIIYTKPSFNAKAEKERLKREKEKEKNLLKNVANNEQKSLTDRTLVKKSGENTAHDDKKITNTLETLKEAQNKEAKDKSQNQKKKEKTPKAQKPPANATPLSVSLIDLRVGHILKAIKHPEAETLYVSTIAMGDKPGTEDTSEYEGQIVRCVCSGLNGLVPLDEMQDRKVIVVCNLKPVKMRGIKSAAMVLAASPRPNEGEEDHHSKTVELVMPPEGAKAGEKVFFEGWKGEPEGILNPKKKIWETFQPGFTTTDNLEVGFCAAAIPILNTEGNALSNDIAKLVTESGGICKVKTLAGAVVR